MPEFRIKKSLVRWHNEAGERMYNGMRRPITKYWIEPTAELQEWLMTFDVKYKFRSSRIDKATKSVRRYYIDIEDENKAMLFKLAWV